MTTPDGNTTAAEWDEVRMGFHTSIMVDTPLNSLAQNLDAPDWPLPGKEETPAKYIDLDFEELQHMPGLAEHPDRIAQLVRILRETMAFDSPFGEMVDQASEVGAGENPLRKNLTKLDISADYPMEFVRVSTDTREFCRLEQIATIGQFADFAQNMPPQVIVGGDFRALLNALANVNEEALARFMPFRPGSRGLHLPEALGLLVEDLSAGERLALARRLGATLKPEQAAVAPALDRDTLRKLEAGLRERAGGLLDWFKGEVDSLATVLKGGETLERHLVVLGDPLREHVVARLLAPALQAAGAPVAGAAGSDKGSRPGFIARLFRKK